jgi:hypothetical protein
MDHTRNPVLEDDDRYRSGTLRGCRRLRNGHRRSEKSEESGERAIAEVQDDSKPIVLKDEATARSARFRPRPATPRTTNLLVIAGIVERVRGQRAESLAVRVGQHVPRALVVKGPELGSSGNGIEDEVSGHAT